MNSFPFHVFWICKQTLWLFWNLWSDFSFNSMLAFDITNNISLKEDTEMLLNITFIQAMIKTYFFEHFFWKIKVPLMNDNEKIPFFKFYFIFQVLISFVIIRKLLWFLSTLGFYAYDSSAEIVKIHFSALINVPLPSFGLWKKNLGRWKLGSPMCLKNIWNSFSSQCQGFVSQAF